MKRINEEIQLRKWEFSDCQSAHSSELETQSSLVCELVIWQKDFEAGNELFQVSKGRDAASGHTPSRSRRLQVPESCNHSCTYCKECKMKNVKFHHGQSLCHFTLTEGAKDTSRNAGASEKERVFMKLYCMIFVIRICV